jgi:hypothetical protein
MTPSIFDQAPERDTGYADQLARTRRLQSEQILRLHAQIRAIRGERDCPIAAGAYHITRFQTRDIIRLNAQLDTIAQLERDTDAILQRQRAQVQRCPQSTLASKTFPKKSVQFILESGETTECPICFEKKISEGKASELLLVVPCGHRLCHACLRGMRRNGRTMKCPFCRGEMKGYVCWKDFQEFHCRKRKEEQMDGPIRTFLKWITGWNDGETWTDTESMMDGESDDDDGGDEGYRPAYYEGAWGTRFPSSWR